MSKKRFTFRQLLAAFVCGVLQVSGVSLTVPHRVSSGVYGDVNCSGVVDIDDVNTVINVMLHKATPADYPASDVNGDGVVDIDDLNEVINVMLHKPHGGTPETRRFTVNGVSFTMVGVQGGTFTMGATAEQGSDADSDEKPAHQVTLSGYSIGATEVTQELWVAVMGRNPSWFNGYGNSNAGSNHSSTNYGTNLQRPVEYVSWNDCQTFITKLNSLTGENFRLPTEAEWEYAARGGSKSKGYKYSGSNTLGDVAWYTVNAYDVGSSSPNYGTHAVATKSPNELGLYDMSGNVWEWCQDLYSSSYYSSSPSTNPTGPSSDYSRVNRGGGWRSSARNCRVSSRSNDWPSDTGSLLGLRLALDGSGTLSHAEPMSLVVELHDGERNVFPLADGSEMAFDGDMLKVASTADTAYFDRTQLYRLYYVPQSAARSLKRAKRAAVDETPKQYAIYIYRNDNDFNAYLNIDVESIRFSPVGTDSVWYDNALVQEVWTPDTVFRTPVAAVDSITFHAPDPEFKNDVFHLTAEHLQYVKRTDGLAVVFNPAIPETLLPARGQVVVSDVYGDPFDAGFAGRVASLQRTDSTLTMACSQVAIEDVYEQILCVGKTVTYQDDDSVASAAGPRRIFDFNDKGVKNIPWGKFTMKLPGVSASVSPSLAMDYIVVFNVKGVPNRFRAVLKFQCDYGLDFNIKEKTEFRKSVFEPDFEPEFVPLPTSIPGVFAKIKKGWYLDCFGNVSLNGRATYHDVFNVGFDSALPDPFVKNKDGRGWGEPEVSLSLNGSVATGPAFQFVAYVITQKWGFPSVHITAKPGGELKGSFTIDDDLFTGDGVSVYESLKDSKVTVAGRLKVEGEAQFIKSFNLPEYDCPIPELLKSDYYLFPEFTRPSLPPLNDDSESNGRSLTAMYSLPSRKLFMPVKVGMGVYDESGKTVKEFFAYESDNPGLEVAAEMRQFAPLSTYQVAPICRSAFTLFHTLQATPATTFKVPETVSLETDKLTLEKGKSQRIAIKGGWGDYGVSSKNPGVCAAALVWHSGNRYVQVEAQTVGTSTVTVTDLRTGEASAVKITVIDNDEPQTRTFTVNGVSFTMVAVEGGTFTMGATAEQGDDYESYERPTHQVTLSSYSIGQTEVTQELWMAVMGSNPSWFNGNRSEQSVNRDFGSNLQRPVEYVSWNDCKTFITKLNALTGQSFRLPTEAEWEYAARGGNKSKGYKYAGSNNIDDVAWYCNIEDMAWYDKWHDIIIGLGKDYCRDEYDLNGDGAIDTSDFYLFVFKNPDYGTHTVGTKTPNELGLYDMSGNVREWCQDRSSKYSSDDQTNPKGSTSGSNRVNRGGSCDSFKRDCRVSYRGYSGPSVTNGNLGLRLAM